MTSPTLIPGTPEWIAAADEAVASVGIDLRDRPADGFVLRQVITDAGAGGRAWEMTLEAGAERVRVRAAGSGDATVTFTTDADTAAAIVSGEESAPEAFLAGRLRIGGDATALPGIAPVMAAIAPAVAAL